MRRKEMKYLKFLLIASFMGIVLTGCTSDSTKTADTSSKQVSSSTVMETSASSTVTNSTSVSQPISTADTSKAQDNEAGLVEADILNSDYTSLNGTWKNSNGYQVTFNNGVVTLSGEGIGGRTEFSLSNPRKQSNVIFLAFEPAPAPNGMEIMLALKGTSPSEGLSTDGTDLNYDRFIMGNNGGTSLFAPKENGGIPDTAYYREK